MSHLNDIPVECTRCGYRCLESSWLNGPQKRGVTQAVCPHCGCKTYYDLRPQVAWCWVSGLIEIGDEVPPDDAQGRGPIVIARGPKSTLKLVLERLARRGHFASAGKLLVPGIPEAENQSRACFALVEWLVKCRKQAHHYPSVQFTPPPSARSFR